MSGTAEISLHDQERCVTRETDASLEVDVDHVRIMRRASHTSPAGTERRRRRRHMLAHPCGTHRE